MQENIQEHKDITDNFDLYYSSFLKIKKIINQNNLNIHFKSLSLDDFLEKFKEKIQDMKTIHRI